MHGPAKRGQTIVRPVMDMVRSDDSQTGFGEIATNGLTIVWPCGSKLGMCIKCAAVMHFCGLGYSRSDAPRGQTSDNFIDLVNLTYEPQFYEFVKPAFNPVGLMLELWDQTLNAGATVQVPVHVVNDTKYPWTGSLALQVIDASGSLVRATSEVSIDPYQKKIETMELELPEMEGEIEIRAVIDYEGEKVASRRKLRLIE